MTRLYDDVTRLYDDVTRRDLTTAAACANVCTQEPRSEREEEADEAEAEEEKAAAAAAAAEEEEEEEGAVAPDCCSGESEPVAASVLRSGLARVLVWV